MKSFARALLRCSLMLLVLAGCSADGSSLSGPPNPDVTQFPAATTPEQLLQNLAKSITTLDVEEFARLMHEDYEFWFSPEDLGATGVESWSRAEDFAAITRMFSGEEGSRGDGASTEVVPAVASFIVGYLMHEPWTESFDDGEAFANADLRGKFRCNMTVRFENADRITEIATEHHIYLVEVVGVVDGEPQTHYQIIGWREFGYSKRGAGIEGASWGVVKALFALE